MENKKSAPTPSFDNWQSAIQHFEKNAQKSIVGLDKFEILLNDVVETETSALFIQNPKLPLSKVIATVFKGINENTPPDLLLKMTQLIIKTWLEKQGTFEKPIQYEFV